MNTIDRSFAHILEHRYGITEVLNEDRQQMINALQKEIQTYAQQIAQLNNQYDSIFGNGESVDYNKLLQISQQRDKLIPEVAKRQNELQRITMGSQDIHAQQSPTQIKNQQVAKQNMNIDVNAKGNIRAQDNPIVNTNRAPGTYQQKQNAIDAQNAQMQSDAQSNATVGSIRYGGSVG